MIGVEHDPATDAIASIKLFKKYNNNHAELELAKKKLINSPRPASFAKKHNFRYEGVCLAGFLPKMCTCGAPTLATY